MGSKKNNKKGHAPLDLNNVEKLTNLKPAPRRNSNVPAVKEFDDLEAFEQYLKDESWDNEFDFVHAKLRYIPPFIMHEIHDNLDKIKPTMNKNSKKFVRHLSHHVDKHLMVDINKASGLDMKFKRVDTVETPNNITWKYLDDSNHGFGEEECSKRHWKVELDVSCNNEDPTVYVDYRSQPAMDEDSIAVE